MLRKLLIASALSSALLVSACATNPDGSVRLPTIPTLNSSQVSQIQSGVAMACSFVPTAQTVAAIIATFAGGSGVVDVAGAAIKGICAALTAKGVRRGTHAPVYRGVVIRGTRA